MYAEQDCSDRGRQKQSGGIWQGRPGSITFHSTDLSKRSKKYFFTMTQIPPLKTSMKLEYIATSRGNTSYVKSSLSAVWRVSLKMMKSCVLKTLTTNWTTIWIHCKNVIVPLVEDRRTPRCEESRHFPHLVQPMPPSLEDSLERKLLCALLCALAPSLDKSTEKE